MPDAHQSATASHSRKRILESSHEYIAETPEWSRIARLARDRRKDAIHRWEQDHGLPWCNLNDQELLATGQSAKKFIEKAGYCTAEENAITNAVPSVLIKNMASGYWTAVQVFKAFAARAALAHHLTNPLTEVFFDKGLTRAQELDRYFGLTGKTIGPLHGLPISVKDVFHIEGYVTTLGYACLAENPVTTTDTLILRLHDAGAVFYCKTNVPQTLMSGECANFVFGRTVSAHNIGLSAGGSSGGEGSLVAMSGSPIGIGTDIAGSIRTPANFNGIYGLCPSFGRLPRYGRGHGPGISAINGVAGPLSRSLDGLQTFTKSVLDLEPWKWDSSCVPLPWDSSLYNSAAPGSGPNQRQLCFGIIPDDSVMTPHPPIQRVLRETRKAIQSKGHMAIDLPGFFDATDDMWELITKIFKADGGLELRTLLSRYNEPLNSQELLEIRPEDSLSATQLIELHATVRDLQQKYLERWRQTMHDTPTGEPVDVLLLPSGAAAACPNGAMEYWLYEAISNILDWTCATIPVGFVDPVLDPVSPVGLTRPLSKHDADHWNKYTPETYANAPLCLQVIGQRFTEERVLGCVATIDQALGRGTDFQAR